MVKYLRSKAKSLIEKVKVMDASLRHQHDSSPSGMNGGHDEAFTIHGFVFCEGKNQDEGEDAEPISENREGRGVLAVFDGMGGAGSEKYRTKEGDTHTGAYFASRIVRELIYSHFSYLIDSKNTSSINAEILAELKQSLIIQLRERWNGFEKNPSRIKTSLRKKLPTTLASIYFFLEENHCAYDVVWAGDSRAYLLMPEGLQQLSRDDVKASTDALSDLTQDSPLSNCISADSDFELRHVSFRGELPIIFVVATDGCYGYVQTPAHFEQMLLQCLQKSNDDREWGAQISASLRAISGDDYSMSVICLGWRGFASIKKAFQDRIEQVNSIVTPIDDIITEINQFDSRMRDLEKEKESCLNRKKEVYADFWSSYRIVYEKRLRED